MSAASGGSYRYFMGLPDGRFAKRKVLECSCWACQSPTRRDDPGEDLEEAYGCCESCYHEHRLDTDYLDDVDPGDA